MNKIILFYMNYFALIFSAIGLITTVCAYKDYDWFMENHRAVLLSKIIGGRENARWFYIVLGLLFIIIGLLGTFNIINFN